jgi:hypothetical protein
MYLCNIVARSRNHYCLGSVTIRFLSNAVDRHVAVINTPVFSVVTELQKWLPFAHEPFRTAVNKINVLRSSR